MARRRKKPRLKGRRTKDALELICLEGGLTRAYFKKTLKTAKKNYWELGRKIEEAVRECYGLLGDLVKAGEGFYPVELMDDPLEIAAEKLAQDFKDEPAADLRKKFLVGVLSIDKARGIKRTLSARIREAKETLGLIK